MNQLCAWLRSDHCYGRWVIGFAAGLMFLGGLVSQHAGLVGAGAVVLCLVSFVAGRDAQHTVLQRVKRSVSQGASPAEPTTEPAERDQRPCARASSIHSSSGPPQNSDEFVEELLRTSRYALLLRPTAKEHLRQSQIVQAIRRLDEAMALVPAGRVLLAQLAEQAGAPHGATDADPKLVHRDLVYVEPVYLDRFAVSNEEFQQFVDAGGYERPEYWHEESLPALLDFVDQTGQPGPRFWSDGRFPSGEPKRPVVGVSWYEAWAYAHWVGKRLPTDAEWTKAGAWPIESSPGRIAQRRYPWGESFELRRANLWATGRRASGDVDEFPAGVSVGGVYQLVGNVWEWTDSPLCTTADPSYHVPDTFQSIRGGAFDTYFECQATCHYLSGDHPLARRHNIGFRLALSMADLGAIVATGTDLAIQQPQPTEPALPTEDAQQKCEVEVTC